MDKEVVVHIHNEILLSHKKNAFESVLMRWMNLEPIIQSEVSQKEKYKYHILMHILEKAMATHSSVLAWRIPGIVGCCLWGHTEYDMTEVT